MACQECSTCQEERKSRARVASGPDDPRFSEEKFEAAPCVFANNDVKYDTNKQRALHFAGRRGAAIVYAIAKDTPSGDASLQRPGLAADKLKWLQRHDRESGDLYGILPLIHKMPAALTDHIDRNPEKNLLRGKVGYIHSWVLDDSESSKTRDGVRILENP